ncbi:hypothetical protein SLEP1_g10422 [Rubroshorea leprosula]|uniref:DC1 domain-containing protein n=1 Tax=Rubroshorea leprosula TaxID=152421 RepID=A0AAV5I818_9ROSI|nr:hypothetical protein SLEP1_g10422 [Rubroshorea leprosula]
MERIDHFSHPHPLVLVDQEPGDHGSRKGFCSGCNEAVEGYCYKCRKAAEDYCSGCEEELEGSSYGCGECGFFLHKKCAELQRKIINHPLHSELPLTLHLEDYAHNSYCTSLHRTIKIIRHPHPLSHIYCFQDEEAGRRECNICHDEINLGYGSYCCSDCNYFAHINCAIDEVLLEDERFKPSDDLIAISPAFQEIKPGEIKHFSHRHNLILSDDGVEDGQSCEGCMRSISTSFYYCAQCNFFLCKCCVHGLPKEVRHWICMHLRELFFYSIFYCDYCEFWSSGFGYHYGQEHFLFFDHKYIGKCYGCDDYGFRGSFRCGDKKCNFALNYRCLVLPKTASYKHDNHALKLTYRDDHDLSQCCCDICEEDRDPKYWFYHCSDCNVFAHLDCVLRESPFVKLGKPFQIEGHEHPVTLVKIDFYPPEFNFCCEPCRDDLSIQCTEPDCTYIIHSQCYWEDRDVRNWYLLHTD